MVLLGERGEGGGLVPLMSFFVCICVCVCAGRGEDWFC